MQDELIELQPKLIETSKETVELIAIIEEETIEVEKKKQVVEADEAVANKAAKEAQGIKVSRLSLSAGLVVSRLSLSAGLVVSRPCGKQAVTVNRPCGKQAVMVNMPCGKQALW